VDYSDQSAATGVAAYWGSAAAPSGASGTGGGSAETRVGWLQAQEGKHKIAHYGQKTTNQAHLFTCAATSHAASDSSTWGSPASYPKRSTISLHHRQEHCSYRSAQCIKQKLNKCYTHDACKYSHAAHMRNLHACANCMHVLTYCTHAQH